MSTPALAAYHSARTLTSRPSSGYNTRVNDTALLHFELTEGWLCAQAVPQAYAPATARAVFGDLATALRAQPAPAILLDARAVSGNPSVTERFLLATHVAGLRIHLGVPLAIVAHEPLVHPRRFGQVVARARGLDVGVFTDLDEATGWLAGRRHPHHRRAHATGPTPGR